MAGWAAVSIAGTRDIGTAAAIMPAPTSDTPAISRGRIEVFMIFSVTLRWNRT
jgi:hypothetical protein